MRHEQMIHMDMNYCDEQTEAEREMRNRNAQDNANVIAQQINHPKHGVHAKAIETVCGWAVEVVTNGLSCGSATLKGHCVDAGMPWHHNEVSEQRAREYLQADGWSCDDTEAVIARCSGQQPLTQVTDPRWKGV